MEGKIIAVWGSPHSGKTTFATKFATAIYSSFEFTVITLYTDLQTPMIPVLFPFDKPEDLGSVGYLLEKAKLAVKKAELSHVFFGRMVTGEAFIADEGREQIIRKFAPLSVDMETAAVVHVCYVNRIPFLSVRSITDTASHSGIDSFEENSAKASEIAAQLTVEIIKEL